MKSLRFLIVLCAILLLLPACKNGKGKGGFLTPTASALPYELLIVIDNQFKDTEAGKAIDEVLQSNIAGLPQPESSFKLMHTDPEHFEGMLKPIRNIVYVNIGKEFSKPGLKKAKNTFATSQSLMTIQAPDEESFVDFVKSKKKDILDFFTNAEMVRQMNILKKNHNDYAFNTIKEMFGCEIYISGDLVADKKGENFFWIGTNEGISDRYFLIYEIPYVDKEAFTKDYFVHKRDSVLKVNIPGEKEGMYMMTEADYTDVKHVYLKSGHRLEARGLWRIKNDMMGGPFVSHMRLDEKNQRLIFTEIFVYAPSKLKRNLVRQMEASLYTLRFAEESENQVDDENMNN